MAKPKDWLTQPAPQDGTVIWVQLPDGKTIREARWNVEASRWENLFKGKWVSMRYAHDARDPRFWWPKA